MKGLAMLLATLFLLNCFTIPIEKSTSTGFPQSENIQILGQNTYAETGITDYSFPQAFDSMVRVYDGENQPVNVILGHQTNVTWMTVGHSTIIKPPPNVESKIDANLLNLTGLVVKGYIQDNQTDIILSFSDISSTFGKDDLQAQETLFNETHMLYVSRRADSEMHYLGAHLNYFTIFDLAKNPLVSRIWLDRKFHACLDQSVPIVKDPAQWSSIEASFGRSINGSEVKIAILDTGIDSTHPDFSFANGTSKIVGAVSFSGESTNDGFGHGTHCASIAAGTGAASSGQYVGVAPSALLLNVKVLNNQGEGLESWVISGIQWAVDNDVNILSMSFGESDGGDGTDPLSTTVNWAVEQGAVCVVAAGNSGSQMYTITSPGVAELAITVGASTKSDLISSFSSRGPTSDYRIKPDIVAPGVDIVAARASNTFMGTPISQYYTQASGTSMATPHVAGAAALLLDAHPSWIPAQIKRALTNYAQDINSNVFDQGSGRLNVCRAANASIIGNSSISFGRVRLNAVYKRIVSFQNLASNAISTTLDADVWHINDGTPYAVASLNPSSFILSYGATGNTDLTLNVDETLPDGYFEGRITAIVGDVTIRIPFFFCIVSQLNVEVIDLQGSPLMALFVLINAETLVTQTQTESDHAQFIMPAGNYIIQAMNVYAWYASDGLDAKTSFIVHRKLSAKTDETISIQLSLASAYELTVRSTDTSGSPLYLVMKQLYTLYGTIGYLSEMGTLTSQCIYLTNISEYMKPPCFFGFAGFPQNYAYWKATETLIPEVDSYFIGWDLSTFGLSTTPDSLDYTNTELANLNIDIMLPKSSATSIIWFNQISGMWQNGFWYGYQTNPGIRWKAHILPYQYKTNPSTSWSDLEWSCTYTLSENPMESPEYYVIDRHFQPISKGENSSYQMGKTPLLPQIVYNNASYYGNGLFIPYYPLLVDGNLFIAKNDLQAKKRVEVEKDGVLIYNKTKSWAQEPIAISQFLKSRGYGLYSFTVKTETSFNRSSQNVGEYTINYTSTSTDLIPPSITKINCGPCFTKNEHQVGVQLADNDEISSVSLFYSTDNGPYLPSSLRNLGNNCFSADLMLPAGTQKLSLVIEASDGNGNKIQFKTDPASVRGYETRIDATVNGNIITGELTVTGGSLLQPVYLKVKSNGKIMYILTDANGNFAFNVPTSFGFEVEIEMSATGAYDGSSWVIEFLRVRTEPAGVVSIPGEGWYVLATDVVLTAPESHISSDTRYRFSYWDVDETSQGSGVNPITVSMNVNHTATAHYKTQYYLTLRTDPTGIAAIPGEGWYDSVASVMLTAPAVKNYQFNYWDVDGASQGNEVNPITVSMNAAHTATAYYTPTSLLHDITITNVTTLQNIVGQGCSTNINVTVTNQGDYSETFDITVYATQTIIATFENTTLTSGARTRASLADFTSPGHAWTMDNVRIELFSRSLIYLFLISYIWLLTEWSPRRVQEKRKKLLICVLLVLFASLVLEAPSFPLVAEAQSTTAVYLDPELIVTQVDSAFSINISIAGVIDLCGWEFKLYYQNSVLNATDYEEGSFLKSGGSTGFYVPRFTDNYNETHGLVGMICTLNDFTNGGVNGSGVLASVTFKAKGAGNSSLALRDTKLRDRDIQPIDHTTADGNVHVLGIGDIAVTGANPSKTIVGQGYPMRINVTVENQGDLTETFNVTTYANDTSIQNKTITLTSKNSTTVTFTWSTTGFAKGNYTISAYAWPVPGETDTADNIFVNGVVKVAIVGDINGGGQVNILDAILLGNAFDSAPGEPAWSPNADLNGDGSVNILDAIMLGNHFDEKES